VADRNSKWHKPEAVEALRAQLRAIRAHYGRQFSLTKMAEATGVSRDIIKIFVRDPEADLKPTTPRSHKDLDKIAEYLKGFEYQTIEQHGYWGLSHPGLAGLFSQFASADCIQVKPKYDGLYVGMAFGRQIPEIFTSVLAIDCREDRLDYAERDVAIAYATNLEGQCLALGNNLVLLGRTTEVESLQVMTLHSDGMLDGDKRVLVGTEYHTGCAGRGSSVARVVLVQVSKGYIEGNLLDAVTESKVFSLLREAQGHGGLPEEGAWEQLGETFAQLVGDDVGKAAVLKARTSLGSFEKASMLF
jgi:hypothetical protein